jgi:hypothetical protein
MMRGVRFIFLLSLLAIGTAIAEDSSSSGDVDLSPEMMKACEALLCLAPEGKAQAECTKPLEVYYDIKSHKRPNFLAKCPTK